MLLFSSLKSDSALFSIKSPSSSAALDFSNLESVTRWTNSVLAELQTLEDSDISFNSSKLTNLTANKPFLQHDNSKVADKLSGNIVDRRDDLSFHSSDEQAVVLLNPIGADAAVPTEAKRALEEAFNQFMKNIESFISLTPKTVSKRKQTKQSSAAGNDTENECCDGKLNGSAKKFKRQRKQRSITWPLPMKRSDLPNDNLRQQSDPEESCRKMTESCVKSQETTIFIQGGESSESGSETETPTASLLDLTSECAITPVPSEAYHGDDERIDDCVSPSPILYTNNSFENLKQLNMTVSCPVESSGPLRLTSDNRNLVGGDIGSAANRSVTPQKSDFAKVNLNIFCYGTVMC